MLIDTNNIVMTKANRNFSDTAHLTEKNGQIVISTDDKSQDSLIDKDNEVLDLTDDEKINVAAKRILEKYRSAFEELAK